MPFGAAIGRPVRRSRLGDALNRLVRVAQGSTLIARNAYDVLDRQHHKEVLRRRRGTILDGRMQEVS